MPIPELKPEKRQGFTDRRRRPTPLFSVYSLTRRGRRRAPRRNRDLSHHSYVDRYDLGTVVILATSLLLCVADAFFTLQLVARGAHEINPFMNFFLAKGPLVFLSVKYVITGISLLLLVVHQNRPLLNGRIRAGHILMVVPVGYALLILWELSLNLRLS